MFISQNHRFRHEVAVVFTTVGGDIEFDDISLVLGRRGSRHSQTKVSELTRHKNLGGQACLNFGTSCEQRLDGRLDGSSSEAAQRLLFDRREAGFLQRRAGHLGRVFCRRVIHSGRWTD